VAILALAVRRRGCSPPTTAMKTLPLSACAAALAVAFATGCTSDPNIEKGPQGTIAYNVPVDASEPGVRIEANGEDMGRTPMMLKIWGDKDGTFHNFGDSRYVVKAYPTKPGQYAQTKVFGTGGWFAPESKVPKKIFFEMGLAPDMPTERIEVITP